MRAILFLSLCITVFTMGQVSGTTWYVNDTVSFPGDGKSWMHAFRTIREGIDAAAGGDTVRVAQGTYVENIQFKGKNIVLTGTDPLNPNVVADTIIDGNKAGSVVTFDGTEDETCVLSGFTICNGSADDGGGIHGGRWPDLTSATIQNNMIVGNWAKFHGGGLYHCCGAIQGNTITDNTAANYAGGGLCNCGGTIQNNTISLNFGPSGGGLAYCGSTIQNNTITSNSAEWGGGLSGCNGTIQNNTITSNSARYGGGLDNCDGIIRNNTIAGNGAYFYGGGLKHCDGMILNCVIWGNKASSDAQLATFITPTYSCIQDWAWGGEGNIALDPQFVDSVNKDYHLSPSSPCIDAGENEDWMADGADLDGNPRIMYGTVDMGACEFVCHQGVTWYVDGSVAGSGDGTNWAKALKTIQEGIEAASRCDTVVVAEGTYAENVEFKGKNITLASTDPSNPDVIERTIIDGNEAGSVIAFDGTEDETCVLSGFTIRNGKADDGGGIDGGKWPDYTRATIQNNTITSNWARLGGGISYCYGTIQNNTITGNSADIAGGLYHCYGTIQNNRISGNRAYHVGGGLYECRGTMQNNIITRNSATKDGGGLQFCDGIIRNNTIAGNTAAQYGGGLSMCGATILNCIIWGNTASTGPQLYAGSTPTYSCIQDWIEGGEGNIALDPRFVDPDGPDNDPATYEDNDYRLSPGSPCIDAGKNDDWMSSATDLDGNPRTINGTVDMGAYERAPSPEISLSTTSLPATIAVGENAHSRNFEVWNSGGGTLSYSVTDNRSWLSCSPTSGTSTGEHDAVTVNYSTSGLSAGNYSATITISDPSASNSPQTVSVSLTVLSPNLQITGVGPVSPQAGPDKQWISILGSGFVPGSRLILTYVDTTYPTIPEDRTRYLSATEMEGEVYLRYGGQWYVQVENPDGSKSNVFPFIVSFDITSFEPACPPASPDKQEVIIRGTGFCSYSEVWFGFGEGSSPVWQIPEERRTAATTTEIRVQAFLKSPGRWCVQVKNPGAESNIFEFDVGGGLTITGIEPTPPWASRDRQWITIRGSGFVNKPQVILFHGEGMYPIPEDRTTFVSSSEVKVYVTLYPRGPWKAQIINPDCTESNVFAFGVALAVTGIEPQCPPRSDSGQWITVRGAGFVSSSKVVLRYGQGKYVIPSDRTTFISSTQMKVFVYLKWQGPWSAQVVNPDGKESNMYSFSVGLAVSYVQPSVPEPGPDKQTLTVFGGGFVQGSQVILRYGAGMYPIPKERTTFASCKEIRVDVYLRYLGLWSAQVRNPDGSLSNIHSFPCGLAITHMVPSSPVASSSAQDIAIRGGGFKADSVVWFRYGSNWYRIPADRTFSQTNLQIDVRAYLVWVGKWAVQFRNPDGRQSNVLEFTVEAASRTSSLMYAIEPALTTSIDPDTGDFVLSSEGVGLQPYIVEASDDLEEWYEVSDVIVPFTDGPVFWRDLDSVWCDRRFYRLLLLVY